LPALVEIGDLLGRSVEVVGQDADDVDHPEFARELLRFVSRVRRMFTLQEVRTHLARIEREQREYDLDIGEDDELQEEDELIRESPAAAAERARQFATIEELLTAAKRGTS
jgi:hypothetical protein